MMNGPKRLTTENWLQLDPALDMFIMVPADGSPPRKRLPDERVASFLTISLRPETPDDVRSIFEAGRAAMVYGHLYYPLFALGANHLFGALEAALTLRCAAAGLSDPPSNLAKKIAWLRDNGVISEEQRRKLDLDRVMRNEGAHPKFQTIFPPGMAYTILTSVAEDIDALFAPVKN
jgi:hypothetical protein